MVAQGGLMSSQYNNTIQFWTNIDDFSRLKNFGGHLGFRKIPNDAARVCVGWGGVCVGDGGGVGCGGWGGGVGGGGWKVTLLDSYRVPTLRHNFFSLRIPWNVLKFPWRDLVWFIVKYFGLLTPQITRYVDGTPTSEVTPVTIQYIHPPHHGNYKVKVMCVFKGKDHTFSPVSKSFAFFLFNINQITIPELQLFWNSTLKIKGQSHGWGQRSRSHSSPSIQPMHLLSCHINRTNHSWDMSNRVFDLEKNTSEIFKENLPI